MRVLVIGDETHIPSSESKSDRRRVGFCFGAQETLGVEGGGVGIGGGIAKHCPVEGGGKGVRQIGWVGGWEGRRGRGYAPDVSDHHGPSRDSVPVVGVFFHESVGNAWCAASVGVSECDHFNK